MAKWKFGIIGCGNVAQIHAQAIHAMENAELVAVYGRNEEKVKSFATTYSCSAFDDLEHMLQTADINIVTVVTPSGAHLDPCVEAAKAGKHIICEKPVEINTKRIQDIISACKEHNVLLSGIYNRRFFPAIQLIKEAIQQNRFGTISLVEAQIKWYRSQEYYDSGEWRGTKKLDGGGVLMNQGIHTIDLLLYLMGPVSRLTASVATLSHERIEVEDTAVALLEFDTGARGVIQGSTSCWSTTGHPAEIHICGNKGSVFLSDDHFRVWDFKEAKEQDDFVRENFMKNAETGMGANDPLAINFAGHKMNFENVVAHLEGKEDLIVTGEESMHAVRIINSIYESASKHGEWITIK